MPRSFDTFLGVFWTLSTPRYQYSEFSLLLWLSACCLSYPICPTHLTSPPISNNLNSLKFLPFVFPISSCPSEFNCHFVREALSGIPNEVVFPSYRYARRQWHFSHSPVMVDGVAYWTNVYFRHSTVRVRTTPGPTHRPLAAPWLHTWLYTADTPRTLFSND